MEDFAVRLKVSRESMGFTQKEVAEEIGVTPSAYANYEQGTREPSLEILVRLTDVLDVSADYLLGIETWM